MTNMLIYSRGLGNYDSGYEGTMQESFLDVPVSATGYAAVDVFRQAVDIARQGIRQSLAGSEEAGEAVKLKLTLDLKGKSLQDLPDEVVDIVKDEVERYDFHSPLIWDQFCCDWAS